MEFGCLPTAIGSMPHTNPGAACLLVSRYLKEIPCWPQLPKRGFVENMYAQFSEGFPGVVIEDDRIHVDRSLDLTGALTELYEAYLANNIDKYPLSREYAAGLHSFLDLENLAPLVVKGQVTGPVSWGLTVTDGEGKAIIYDDLLGDAVPKLLRLKASWQEKELSKISKNTIIFVDEPYMSAFGSIAMNLSKERIINLLDEVFAGINGLKGVHCCGNTDWSILLATKVDILSFDAYNYAQSLSLYPAEAKKLLSRGGAIAWGIVPNDEPSLVKETVASLKDRLEEAMAPFTRNGISFKDLIKQSLLTPSCTLTPLSEDGAEQALKLLAELSVNIRKRYG